MHQTHALFSAINAFDRLTETHYLPASSQLIWYKLLGLFNRSTWAEWIEVDNQRLMALIQCKREATFIEMRNHLIRAGLIEYQKGRKGVVGKYKLTFASVVNSVSNSVSNSVVNSVSNSVSNSVDTSSSYPTDTQKTKTKTKTNTINARDDPRTASKAMTFGKMRNVFLTQEEVERLRADYPDADDAIDWLSLYIADKGYKVKGKTHNLTIRRWVITAYREHKEREVKAKPAVQPQQGACAGQPSDPNINPFQRRGG